MSQESTLETYLTIARDVAKELMSQGAKLVVLSGSAARGKPNPNDLDIFLISENNSLFFSNDSFGREFAESLIEKFGVKIQLFNFSENFSRELIDAYNKTPQKLFSDLCMKNMDDWRENQWDALPLVWIFGDKAREKFDGYQSFHDGLYQFIVLEGHEYLEYLRTLITR